MATDAPTATGVSTAEKATWERIKEPAVYVRLISLVVVIGGWELMGQTGNIDPVTFSYPSAIAVAFWELTVSGKMTAAAYESSQILVAGLLIAIPLGIVLGILMGRFQMFEYAVDTYVFALYATPRFVRWSRFGSMPERPLEEKKIE